MFDERLLERIHNLEKSPGVRVERSYSILINSIVNHLQRMLNTHQGNVSISEDYGIPDITNTPGESFGEMARNIEKNLQQLIIKYEPRLTDVHLTLTSDKDDVLSVKFKLEAILLKDKTTPVVLETVISSEGNVRVLNQ
jgi:type VI secretion system protein